MKIVIDIPKEYYETLKEMSDETLSMDMAIIKYGTPIPEPHGRIIDESKIKNIVCNTEQELYGNKIRYVKATDAPTIIEGSENE